MTSGFLVLPPLCRMMGHNWHRPHHMPSWKQIQLGLLAAWQISRHQMTVTIVKGRVCGVPGFFGDNEQLRAVIRRRWVCCRRLVCCAVTHNQRVLYLYEAATVLLEFFGGYQPYLSLQFPIRVQKNAKHHHSHRQQNGIIWINRPMEMERTTMRKISQGVYAWCAYLKIGHTTNMASFLSVRRTKDRAGVLLYCI